jgi:hypothetical protein
MNSSYARVDNDLNEKRISNIRGTGSVILGLFGVAIWVGKDRRICGHGSLWDGVV